MKEKFSSWTYEDYVKSDVIPIEPMTAKEEEREVELRKMLESNSGYYVEEKLDGTRATLHFREEGTRAFSRRISKKTNWYAENSDSLPHIRDLVVPNLFGTVLDGEMYIPNRPFKDVSSTLNCNPSKAIERQLELGRVHLKAFDIIYYKGIYIAQLPLRMRKQYLSKVIRELREIDVDYIEEIQYSDDRIEIKPIENFIYRPNYFPYLKEALEGQENKSVISLDKKAYYEYIVATGGEGVILKNAEGKYYHKRGREYTKIKKFLTKDCIILGFNEPTKEYKGKAPKTWEYYEDEKPVSKFYKMNWVGNIRFGVIITKEEEKDLLNKGKIKPTDIHSIEIEGEVKTVLEVGECSGYDEDTREYFTNNQDKLIGTTVEILANELFNDTGKLRHPRFHRLRPDKSPLACIFKDHIGG